MILRSNIFDNVPQNQHFDDVYFWSVPDDEEKTKLMVAGGDKVKKGMENRTFDFEMGAESDTKNVTVSSQAL